MSTDRGEGFSDGFNAFVRTFNNILNKILNNILNNTLKQSTLLTTISPNITILTTHIFNRFTLGLGCSFTFGYVLGYKTSIFVNTPSTRPLLGMIKNIISFKEPNYIPLSRNFMNLDVGEGEEDGGTRGNYTNWINVS